MNNDDAGFSKLPNAVWQPYREGKLSFFDVALYAFVNAHCNWQTGIYHGTALGIAMQGRDARAQRAIQKSLLRLRGLKLINYAKGGSGEKGGGYDILVDGFSPTVGAMVGMRLNAWTHGTSARAKYESGGQEGMAGGTPEGMGRGRPGGMAGGTYSRLIKINSDIPDESIRSNADTFTLPVSASDVDEQEQIQVPPPVSSLGKPPHCAAPPSADAAALVTKAYGAARQTVPQPITPEALALAQELLSKHKLPVLLKVLERLERQHLDFHHNEHPLDCLRDHVVVVVEELKALVPKAKAKAPTTKPAAEAYVSHEDDAERIVNHLLGKLGDPEEFRGGPINLHFCIKAAKQITQDADTVIEAINWIFETNQAWWINKLQTVDNPVTWLRKTLQSESEDSLLKQAARAKRKGKGWKQSTGAVYPQTRSTTPTRISGEGYQPSINHCYSVFRDWDMEECAEMHDGKIPWAQAWKEIQHKWFWSDERTDSIRARIEREVPEQITQYFEWDGKVTPAQDWDELRTPVFNCHNNWYLEFKNDAIFACKLQHEDNPDFTWEEAKQWMQKWLNIDNAHFAELVERYEAENKIPFKH